MKRTVNCIIIDDEPPASDVLRCYIDKTPDFKITAVYHDPVQAFNELCDKEADVIFCDVEMPDINGLQLLEVISSNKDVLIVLVSAHAKYAIDGFNVNAIDYLLKPVSFARYMKATQKIWQAIKQKTTAVAEPEDTAYSTESSKDYFFIKSDSKLLKIGYDEILYIEGYGDYVKIFTDNNPSKPHLILDSLKRLEEVLPHPLFRRIHRSYIVPVSRIKAIEYKKAILDKNLSLPISNSYYDGLYESLVRDTVLK